LADIDGLSIKAAIDGIVEAGILADDSPKQVKEIRNSQSKGKIEKTTITIEEI
jgi:Holliday junction resolvase RusA-like endonuclease